jgi:hypothetical protein
MINWMSCNAFRDNKDSIIHLERRTILGPRLAVIVDAGGGDVGVVEPLLNLRDVGLVVERIGWRPWRAAGGRRSQSQAPLNTP